MAETMRKKVKFGNEEIDAIYRKARKPVPPQKKEVKDKAEANWDGLEEKSLHGSGFGICPDLNRRTYLAEEGILCEQDVPVTLRDGVVIYTDIFRPVGQTNIPALVSWSYFGKRPGDGFDEWQIIGVPPGTVSRMAKFESPDPGYWCRNGYAVANVDPRGIGHSEGMCACSARRTDGTAMISSNGLPPSIGATARSGWAAIPAWP